MIVYRTISIFRGSPAQLPPTPEFDHGGPTLFDPRTGELNMSTQPAPSYTGMSEHAVVADAAPATVEHAPVVDLNAHGADLPTSPIALPVTDRQAYHARRHAVFGGSGTGEANETHPQSGQYVSEEEKLALWAKRKGLGQTVASIAHRNLQARLAREQRPTGAALVDQAQRARRLGDMLANRRGVVQQPPESGSQQTA